MQILDGRMVAQKIKTNLQNKIFDFLEESGKKKPCLAIILVGDNPASKIYIKQKIKFAEEIGVKSQVFCLDTHQAIRQKIESLNKDPEVHAILVQLPLPASLDFRQIISYVDPRKDPDCLTVTNQGLAWSGRPRVLPCTPFGIMKLLEHYNISLKGKTAVVVGRSQIVGLPMVQVLLRANATVSVCHSQTKNLSSFTERADIVVVAAGIQGFLGKKDFKKGAIVVDVGIHRAKDREKNIIKGDVRFEELKDHVKFATPVPGGVGPMTVAMLLENTFKLYQQQMEKESI